MPSSRSANRSSDLISAGFEAAKRLIDILGAAAAIVLFPLMGLTQMAVRLNTEGPVVLRQERLVRGNSRFPLP